MIAAAAAARAAAARWEGRVTHEVARHHNWGTRTYSGKCSASFESNSICTRLGRSTCGRGRIRRCGTSQTRRMRSSTAERKLILGKHSCTWRRLQYRSTPRQGAEPLHPRVAAKEVARLEAEKVTSDMPRAPRGSSAARLPKCELTTSNLPLTPHSRIQCIVNWSSTRQHTPWCCCG